MKLLTIGTVVTGALVSCAAVEVTEPVTPPTSVSLAEALARCNHVEVTVRAIDYGGNEAFDFEMHGDIDEDVRVFLPALLAALELARATHHPPAELTVE